jgi:hypothetical protein
MNYTVLYNHIQVLVFNSYKTSLVDKTYDLEYYPHKLFNVTFLAFQLPLF